MSCCCENVTSYEWLWSRMNRYLLNISYIGTRFRGIQKTINKSEAPRTDTATVQGCIDLALKVLHPVNEIRTVLSSRTDAGVHALHSTVHVDLQRYDSQPYNTSTITSVLNRTLDKHRLPIRVLSAIRVPESFHCRYNALGRTYLYRFAVTKSGTFDSNSVNHRTFEVFQPVEEADRCFFVQSPTFDIERFQEGSRMFLGLHDFRTFMSVSRQRSASRDHPMYTVRKIDEINISPGRSLAVGANAQLAESLYNYWDVEIKARSFLYKQVRRIVGSLLALAKGQIDEKCIYEMLTVPSKHSWDSRILLSPAEGLYLCRVHYDDNDFQIQN